eukprot:5789051-Prymnesium_polylepis.2
MHAAAVRGAVRLLALTSNPAVGRCRSLARMNSAAALPEMMTEHEKFMFDLNGFIVVRNVFSADEVAAANRAVDALAAGLQPRDEAALRNAETGSPLAATGPRLDMGGMLLWPEPHCNSESRRPDPMSP